MNGKLEELIRAQAPTETNDALEYMFGEGAVTIVECKRPWPSSPRPRKRCPGDARRQRGAHVNARNLTVLMIIVALAWA